MCGITGYITTKTKPIDANENLTRLLLASQVRGTDATGIATITKNKTLLVCKSNKRASQFTKNKTYLETLAKTGKIAIGHTRATTQGEATDNKNNHPIYLKSGLAIVHNGIINNDKELFTQHKLKQDGAVDSEVIVRMVEKYKNTARKQTTTSAIKSMSKRTRGSFAFLLIDRYEPNTIYAVKRTNPLALAYHKKTGMIYIASTVDILENALIEYRTYCDYFTTSVNKHDYIIRELENNTGLRITTNGIIERFTVEEPPIVYTSYPRYDYPPVSPLKPTKQELQTAQTKLLSTYTEDKKTDRDVDQWNSTQWKDTVITKPSVCCNARLEARLYELDTKEGEQPLTPLEKSEQHRIENALDDRYYKPTWNY